MIIVYWKWEVWIWLENFLNYFWDYPILMDDEDINENKLKECDYIVPSPWIKPNHIIYEKYWNKIISELDIVYKYLEKKDIIDNFKFIWITWTKWKSTTSWIVYNILKNLWEYTFIWWNFSPSFWQLMFNLITENNYISSNLEKEINIVIEVSSFMLYKTDKFRFDNSVITNIEPDHLDWHKDIEDYIKTKEKIIYLTNWNTIIWNEIDINSDKCIKVKNNIKYNSQLIWDHNQYNINLSYNLIKEFFIEKNNLVDDIDKKILKIIEKIKPLKNRLELIRTIWNINIYNDWKSTTPWSLEAAIKSFDKKVILIAWWSDKWADFDYLKETFQNNLKFAALIWQTAEKIWKVMKEWWGPYKIYNSLEEAVAASYEFALKEDNNILFSPWCASFWMFKNWEDRVNKFIKIIKDL